MIKIFAKCYSAFLKVLNFFEPLGYLAARWWVAYIFFMAGLTKIQNWDSTMMLFEHEYSVPILSPTIAAYLGTGLELVLPVLLVLGLGGRLIIFMFFCYNLVAMISYPFLWTPEGRLGLDQHINWGLLLALVMFHGSGKLSLDYLFRKKYGHHMEAELQES